MKKINGIYYVEFEARGLRYQQKVGPDKQAAQRLLASIEEKIRQGELGILDREIEIAVFAQDFFEAMKQYGTTEFWAGAERVWNDWLDFLNKEIKVERLSQVTPRVVALYLESRRKKFAATPRDREYADSSDESTRGWPRVAAFFYVCLDPFFDLARKQGYIHDNPLQHARWPAWRNPAWLECLSDDEAEGLREGSSFSAGKVVALLGLESGLTLEETAALRWKDLIEEDGVWYWRVGVSGRSRRVPVSLPIRNWVEEMRPARFRPEAGVVPLPLSADSGKGGQRFTVLKEEWARYLRGRGWDKFFSGAALRHRFAHDQLVNGISPFRLARLLGLRSAARVIVFREWFRPSGAGGSLP